jgi:hypothetical protein
MTGVAVDEVGIRDGLQSVASFVPTEHAGGGEHPDNRSQRLDSGPR